jgi:thioredoxin-related protein
MRHLHTKATFAIIIALLFSTQVFAQNNTGLKWYTDVMEAKDISNKTKKPIFAFFTGSDWCGWCKRLQAAVFAKPEFQTWAKKNVVLLELDFPRNKQLPEKLAQQNNELQSFFQVQGFPTVWLCYMDQDKKTKKMSVNALGSLGYPKSEPGKEAVTFVQNANDILKAKKQ